MYGYRPYSSIPYSSANTTDVGAPFVPKVWDNPRGPRRVITLWGWSDSFKLPLQQTLPPRQTDWPVPKGPLRARDYTWAWSLTTQGIPQPPSPYNQYDWPVPKGPLYPLSLRTWTDAFKLPYQEFLPPRQLDWPNPRGPLYPTSLRVWWQISLPNVPPDAPVLNQVPRDWPVPRGRQFPISLRFWAWSSLRYIGQDRPHRQRDWPNPVRRKADANRYISHDGPTKPQYPPVEQMPLNTLRNRSGRVRELENEIQRVRFLVRTMIE